MLRKLSHPSNRHIFSQIECLLTRSTSADLKVIARLRIKDLISSLYMAAHEINLTKNQGHIDEISKTLRNLRANLQRRKKASDPLTSSRLMEIPEPARAILLSDIAYTFRDEIDAYTQIDSGNDKHVKLLKVAVDRSIAKVAGKQGRPVNEPMDEFFIGLRDLYVAATGKKATAEARYSNKPKTDFEKLIYLGYQIIRPAQEYQAAHKAYERAINRNS